MAEAAQLLNSQSQEQAIAPIRAVSYGKSTRPLLTEELHAEYQKTLRVFSDSDFDDNKWSIRFKASRKEFTLTFPPTMAPTDSQILRIAVLNSLLDHASESMAKRIISNGLILLRYFESKRLYIENTRQVMVQMVIDHLNDTYENSSQKNNILRVFELLFIACADNGYIENERAVSFSFRFPVESKPKRAPDKCVSDAITKIIFDPASKISLPIRCVLMLLRMIPKRISEICAMDLECVSYPDEGCFSISITTSKETTRHVPQVHWYKFRLEGYIENMLYTALRHQQDAVRDKQNEIDAAWKGYLFYLPGKRRLLSTEDVNECLRNIIADYHITDSQGEQAVMTSHDFRHLTINERQMKNIFALEEISREANHSNIEQTLAYGYPSVHDEAKHLAAIMHAANSRFAEEDNKAGTVCRQELVQAKYKRLEAQPFTRLIPGFGLCTNLNCKPQFEKCVSCNLYTPESVYLEYFEAARILVEQKLAALRNKKGNAEAISYNEKQLSTITAYIERLDDNAIAKGRGA